MQYVKGDYFIVPNKSALKGVHYRDRSAFMALCDMANDKGVCWPSYQTLADAAGMSRDSAMKSIQILEKLGFICKTSRSRADGSQTSNEYQIMLLGSRPEQGGGGRQPLGVVAESHSNYNHIELENSFSTKNVFSDEESGVDVELEMVDDNGDVIVPKKPKPRTDPVLQHFALLSKKYIGTEPAMPLVVARTMLGRARLHLTDDQIKNMFEDWFSMGKPDNESVQITRALSTVRINQYRVDNGIK